MILGHVAPRNKPKTTFRKTTPLRISILSNVRRTRAYAACRKNKKEIHSDLVINTEKVDTAKVNANLFFCGPSKRVGSGGLN